MKTPLQIEHILVKKDRMIADVAVSDSRFAYTNPALIERLSGDYPFLLSHACVNDKGTTFGAVAERTSLPHLLEHMVIEDQVRLERLGSCSQPVLYTGKTFWTNEEELKARIEVRYADDLVALRAFRIASERLNSAVLE